MGNILVHQLSYGGTGVYISSGHTQILMSDMFCGNPINVPGDKVAPSQLPDKLICLWHSRLQSFCWEFVLCTTVYFNCCYEHYDRSR